MDDSGLDWWPRKKRDPHDPRGRPVPNPAPEPAPPRPDPKPHLPEVNQTPNPPATQKGCCCGAVIEWANGMNTMWHDILSRKLLQDALKQCAQTARSGSGAGKCCVVSWAGVQGCITGDITWRSTYGHVQAKPCNQVRDEIKRNGSIGVCYGRNTVSRIDYYDW